MEKHSEAPYPLEHGQLLACPSCRAGLEHWPQRAVRCPACGERVQPKRRVASQLFVLCSDAQADTINAEWATHNERLALDKAVRDLRVIITGLQSDEIERQLDSFEDLLTYAIRVGSPSWPDVMQRVEKARLQRDAELHAMTTMQYRFVASEQKRCSRAQALHGKVKSAAAWYAGPPRREPQCSACSCRLESLIPGIDTLPTYEPQPTALTMANVDAFMGNLTGLDVAAAKPRRSLFSRLFESRRAKPEHD